MTDSKMLQILIDGQASLRKSMTELQKEVRDGFAKVQKDFKETHRRIDKIGKSVAFLETDTPTAEDFDNLEKRVDRIENKLQKPPFRAN